MNMRIPAAKALARKLNMKFVPKLNADPSYAPIKDPEFVRRETGLTVVSRDEMADAGEIYLADRMCSQLWEPIQLNADGRVLGCCFNYKSDFGGNAFEDINSAINSEKLIYARAMVSDDAPPRDDIPCTTCSVYEKRKPLEQMSYKRRLRQKLVARSKEALMKYDEMRWRLAKKGIVNADVLNFSRI